MVGLVLSSEILSLRHSGSGRLVLDLGLWGFHLDSRDRVQRMPFCNDQGQEVSGTGFSVYGLEFLVYSLPIVSIVVPFLGLTKYIMRIL